MGSWTRVPCHEDVGEVLFACKLGMKLHAAHMSSYCVLTLEQIKWEEKGNSPFPRNEHVQHEQGESTCQTHIPPGEIPCTSSMGKRETHSSR